MKYRFIVLCLTLPLHLMAFSMQAEVSYFRPTATVLRDIYGAAWVDYKFEIEQPCSYTDWFWKRISVFADASYLSNEGRSEGGDDGTRIQMILVSLGVKWIEPLNSSINFYLGAAPRYFFVYVHDHLPQVKERTHKSGLGGVVITGLTFDLGCKNLYLDLFASYSFKRLSQPSTPARVTGHSLQVGGLDVGGGLGWQF